MIDEKVAGYIKRDMDKSGQDYRLMILPDHPTPISLRTHTSEPVPFLIFDSRKKKDSFPGSDKVFSEKMAASTGMVIEKGYTLADYFFQVDKSL